MTPRDRRVLAAIDAATLATGLPPTLRELMRDLGWKSKGNVSAVIGNLVAAGCVERVDPIANRSRNWTVTELGRATIGGFSLHAVPEDVLVEELARRGFTFHLHPPVRS